LKNEAENYLKQAIQLGQGYPDCYYHYAIWLLKNGRSEEAFSYLSTALELSPEHEGAKPLMAALLARSKVDLKLLEEQAFALNTPEGHLSLSLKYYYRGRYEDCIKACQLALKLKPDYAAAYNNICTAYNKMGRYEEGIKACEKALEFQPDFPLAKGNLDWARQKLTESQ
jgi:tetratricopeptide (TPR) repeat protein